MVCKNTQYAYITQGILCANSKVRIHIYITLVKN